MKHPKHKPLLAALLTAALVLSACSDIGTPPENSSAEESSTPSLPPETQSTEDTTTGEPQTVETTTEPPPLATIKENIDYEAFDRRIEEIADSLNAVGMGLAVFANGEVIYTVNCGYSDVGAGRLADDGTHYRSASVSKMISAMVLMTLYDQGVLDPYSELEELTGLPYNDPSYDTPVLLWHLLTHTAGFVDSYAYDKSPSYKSSLDYVLTYSRSGYAPGTLYAYSNFGAGSVGGIIEKLTGEFFHDYADRVLFEPLGMDAGYCIDLLEDRDNTANLYEGGTLVYTTRSWGRTTKYYESYGLGNSYLTAQCELLISPSDLARLGIILAGDGTLDGVRVLSEEAVNAMNATYYTDESLFFDEGLAVRKYIGNFVPNRTIHGHSGQAFGCTNGLYFDPSDGTGVAICSSGCSVATNPDNGVFLLLDKCVNEVYATFFD